ncbi:MAG: HAD-IA family hydrolase [Deferribacteraceae bacterium]|jgi:sugar-phosphatase|nr:HAD-IA family hydrolase [Deferribacteraceae bacterium]
MTQLFVKGFLFDMDGTLADSEGAIGVITERLCKKYGLNLAEVETFARGRRSAETIYHFVKTDPATALKEFDDAELAATDGIKEISGAGEFLAQLPVGSWVLVTSAGRELAGKRMAAAGLNVPPVVISSECVSKGKPDPEGYLKGANALGIDPKELIVFEDAASGINAALTCGAHLAVVGDSDAAQGREAFKIQSYHELTVMQHADGFIISKKA